MAQTCEATDIEQCGPSRQNLQAMIKRCALNASAAKPSNAPRGAGQQLAVTALRLHVCRESLQIATGVIEGASRRLVQDRMGRIVLAGPRRTLRQSCEYVRSVRVVASTITGCFIWQKVQAHISVTLHRQRCAQLAAAMSTVPLRSKRSAR